MALFTIQIELHAIAEKPALGNLHAEMAKEGFYRTENSTFSKCAWGLTIAEYQKNAELSTAEVLALANTIAEKAGITFNSWITKNYAVNDWYNFKQAKKTRKQHFFPINFSGVYF